MGMFDWVSSEIVNQVITKCPICQCDIDTEEWQTKDLKNLLDTIDLDYLRHNSESFYMHNICSKCGNYIEQYVDINKLDLSLDMDKSEFAKKIVYTGEHIIITRETILDVEMPLYNIWNKHMVNTATIQWNESNTEFCFYPEGVGTIWDTKSLKVIESFLVFVNNKYIKEDMYD